MVLELKTTSLCDLLKADALPTELSWITQCNLSELLLLHEWWNFVNFYSVSQMATFDLSLCSPR